MSYIITAIIAVLFSLFVIMILEIRRRRRTIRIYQRPRLDNIFRSRRSRFSKQRKIEKGLVVSLLTGSVAGLVSYSIYKDINLSAITAIITIFLFLIPFLSYMNRRELEKGGKKMGRVLKAIWNNTFLSSFAFATLGLAIFFAMNPKLFTSRFFIAILIGMPLFIILLLGSLVITASVLISKKTGSKTQIELVGDKGIWRNIKENYVWVVRNAWHSDPGYIDPTTSEEDPIRPPTGYNKKSEGWRFYLPYIWQIDLGVFDISPKPQDPDPITVNTADNQTATIDWRIETFISDPVKFAIRVRTEEEREKFERQRVTAILAQICSGKTQADLTHFKDHELRVLGREAMDHFNKWILPFGIQATALDIQRIIPPREVVDAAEYVTVSQKRKEAAKIKGEELQELIKATQADGTKVLIADILRGAAVDLAYSLIPKPKNKKEE